MAYFECIVGNNGGGIGNTVIIVPVSIFAGLTLTCSNGVQTYTQTIPSTAPYDVTFSNLPDGDYTCSVNYQGQTYSESFSFPQEVELTARFTIAVDIYSAADDTLSYSDAAGSKTVTTDSSGHGNAVISLNAPQTILFTSSVAKNPTSLSDNYSKSIYVDGATTAIYVMPNEDVVYWYGYEGPDFSILSTANGWSSNFSFIAPTKNTHYITGYASSANSFSGFGGTKSIAENSTIYAITQGVRGAGSPQSFGAIGHASSKSFQNTAIDNVFATSNALQVLSLSYDAQKRLPLVMGINTRSANFYALWYE